MSAFTDAVAVRYAGRETEADAFGRVIEVRRLRPADSFWIRQIAASDLADVTTEALVASSVCSVTDAAGKRLSLNPPRNAAELSARLDFLEREGMSAAMTAYARLMAAGSVKAAKPKASEKQEGGALDGEKVADAVTGHMAAAAEHGKRPRRTREPVQQAAE